jgi:hypothetical protein
MTDQSTGTSDGDLPPGWHQAVSDDGEVYYYHDNGQTTWDRPDASSTATVDNDTHTDATAVVDSDDADMQPVSW